MKIGNTWRALLVTIVAGALVGGSTTWAVGSSAGTDADGPFLTAADCPEAAALFEEENLPVPLFADPTCPALKRIRAAMPLYADDVEGMRQVNPRWGLDR